MKSGIRRRRPIDRRVLPSTHGVTFCIWEVCLGNSAWVGEEALVEAADILENRVSVDTIRRKIAVYYGR
jgi:hypothetical protein